MDSVDLTEELSIRYREDEEAIALHRTALDLKSGGVPQSELTSLDGSGFLSDISVDTSR